MATQPQPIYTSPRNDAHLRDVLSRLSQSLSDIVVDITDLENTLLREAIFDSTTTQGQVVYAASAGHVELAIASAVATARVSGIAIENVTGGETGLYLVTGSLQRTGWGLTTNSIYYLSPTGAGNMTTTQPTTIGQVVKPLGIAVSTEIFSFIPQTGILL